MKFFGEHIRELRVSQGIPLRKVAAHLDLDTSILSKMERGEREPNKEMVNKIASFFSVDAEILLKEFFSDRVAKTLYNEDEVADILRIAVEKIRYLKDKQTVQGQIVFKNE